MAQRKPKTAFAPRTLQIGNREKQSPARTVERETPHFTTTKQAAVYRSMERQREAATRGIGGSAIQAVTPCKVQARTLETLHFTITPLQTEKPYTELQRGKQASAAPARARSDSRAAGDDPQPRR